MQAEFDVERPSYQQLNEETPKSTCLYYQDDPITLYNQFIRLYNQDINQVNGIRLEEMKSSKVVQFIHNYLRNFVGSFVLLIILFIPLLNIGFYILILFAAISLNQNYLIFRNNISKCQIDYIGLVLDPFGNMVENQDICVMMKKNYLVFKLDIKETEGLHFSKNVKEMIKNRSSGTGDNKIEFTIYNQNLKQDYYGFPNYRCSYLVWSLSGCLIIIAECTTSEIMFYVYQVNN
ncbi:unnamed protein product (macronuclear) [Paramecium tetraurelia]|uniref:Transmembrane protein n=1 Tax=Paramecium tetraurelia TaxID=5888 RepID=A0BCX9_PARTE|nr:uncharacterized protein GSPATT00004490001 [Paramecium tetraurelia]CAK56396.1 unnamed protein product [Paramecium tetraurelia]|eukprot:XP_001423794.1 hypothetical protein (macronuclear) [Paramecium tetraurelia strain d4-2]